MAWRGRLPVGLRLSLGLWLSLGLRLSLGLLSLRLGLPLGRGLARWVRLAGLPLRVRPA
ncbi:hypothetical protein SAMN05216174_105294 [Actinokineospora iranica]|uniref:Uncharacterized protein n=1 Tax=Actinokineospora iranica TaxID=1271860 RepID=A0A1G6QHW2_9PSEU|nr:hypothetical protein SAMN05216174_105294 [Actinokineospora iranica]